ncbi:MAG: SDR family oxidoreductase [Betaproteobacteria bacterium]|nr:MAG: SDR family oxidoreductase [Betaproteobacteria bacterium]
MQLNGARILLTGASGGLGQALAHALTLAGASLLLAGRDPVKLANLQIALRTHDTKTDIATIAVDLTHAAAISRLSAEAARFKVTILINNAGINAFGLFEQHDWADAARVLETNLIAPMRLTHTLLPQLKAYPQAAIVNIGSTFGSLPFPCFTAYSTAKAGVKGFSQALRRELSDTPIEVIYIAPRTITTALNSSAVNALNHAMGNHSDSPASVARQIVIAIANSRLETHLGFPERLFAWMNGCMPKLIDLALRKKLALIKRHAL